MSAIRLYERLDFAFGVRGGVVTFTLFISGMDGLSLTPFIGVLRDNVLLGRDLRLFGSNLSAFFTLLR